MVKIVISILAIALILGFGAYFLLPEVTNLVNATKPATAALPGTIFQSQALQSQTNPDELETANANVGSSGIEVGFGFYSGDKTKFFNAEAAKVEGEIPGMQAKQAIENANLEARLNQILPGEVAAENAINDSKANMIELQVQDQQNKIEATDTLRRNAISIFLVSAVVCLLIILYFLPTFLRIFAEGQVELPKIRVLKSLDAAVLLPSVVDAQAGNSSVKVIYKGLPAVVNADDELDPSVQTAYINASAASHIADSLAGAANRGKLSEAATKAVVNAFSKLLSFAQNKGNQPAVVNGTVRSIPATTKPVSAKGSKK